ncbi:MAG: O-antigen ligase family protein [Devosiaceae bacterium]
MNSAATWNASATFFYVRNSVFFIAVLAMNYTLMRPSPVDFLFLIALGLSLLVNQPVRKNVAVAITVIIFWMIAYMNASLPYAGDTDVQHELLAKTLVGIVAVLTAFAASSWRKPEFITFLMVYMASTTIAATIGIGAFAIGHPTLTWDGRAMAFIDDPNMFSSFLIPGILAAIYLMKERKLPWIIGLGCALVIAVGITVAFSRIASVAMLFTIIAYLTYLNRKQLPVFIPKLILLALIGFVGIVVALSLSEEFAHKFLERLSFAKSYDVGREGRLGRYLLVLPMILENPRGVGVLQLEYIFPEPIHNIFLSAFVNYGWLGGISWLTLWGGAFVAGLRAYQLTRSDIPVVLMLGLLGISMCAALHEAEHWRHLWLFIGLTWGFSAQTFLSCAKPTGQAKTALVGA